MADYPLLLQGDMVVATLRGLKTQTRHPVKIRQDLDLREVVGATALFQIPNSSLALYRPHPYGAVGDHLYVRETFWIEHDWDSKEFSGPFDCGINLKEDTWATVWYCATDKEPTPDEMGHPLFYSKHPSIHLPKWASRLWLTVLNVRVERVNSITEEDAVAEGFEAGSARERKHLTVSWTAKASFLTAWDKIYEKRGYGVEVNPWVWVTEYEVYQILKGETDEQVKI